MKDMKMNAKRTRQQTNTGKVFLLSGIPNDKRQEYGKIIRSLGGVYFDVESFKATCTHIIVGKLSRSEKFLGGCATGKWILKPDFIEDSFKKQAWLQEEFYEWTADDAMVSEAKEIASAPRRWRESFLLNQSSFTDMKVAILVEGTKRKTVYKRLLSCGGATVYNLQLPVTKPEKIASVLEYIFADRSLASEHLPPSLLDYGILCLSPDYIGDFLIKETSPDPCDYLVVGPHALLSSIPKVCTDDSIIMSQSSTSSRNSLSSTDNTLSSEYRVSPLKTQLSPAQTNTRQSNRRSQRMTRKQDNKTSRKSVKIEVTQIKPKMNTQLSSKKLKNCISPGQQRLHQFGFMSVKKEKKETVTSDSPSSTSKKVDTKCTDISNGLDYLKDNNSNHIKHVFSDISNRKTNTSLISTEKKVHVHKRLDFDDKQTITNSLHSVLDITDSTTTNSSDSRKRKITDLVKSEPVKKRMKFGPIYGKWKPISQIHTLKSQQCDKESDKFVSEIPLSIGNLIETYIEDEYLLSGINLLRSISSTKYYLPPTLLHSLMVNVLLESPTKFVANQALMVLMNYLSLHPPITQQLQTVYQESLSVCDDDTSDNKMFTFICTIIKAALNEVKCGEEEGLYNNLLLLQYVLAVMETSFTHFINRLESGDCGKTIYRQCLFMQFLWLPGFQIFTNKRTREVLQYHEECLVTPATSTHKLKLLQMLTGFINMAAQCLKLAESGWSISANRNPTTGDRSRGFIDDFGQSISVSHVEDSGVLELLFQWITPSWFCLGVGAKLLSTYDDYLLLEGIDHSAITLAKIVTQYFFLLPRLQCTKQDKLLAEKKHIASDRITRRTLHKELPVNKMSPLVLHSSNNIKKTDQLTKKVNKKNLKGETPLHIACIKNDVRKVKELLSVPGINVNAVDNYGWSPLHEACNHGHIECVQLLLKYSPLKTVEFYFNSGSTMLRKVDLLNANVDGITALHDAAIGGWSDICQLLLKHGGQTILEAKTKAGKKPIDFAATEELQKILSKTLDFSFSQDSQSSSQSSFDSRLNCVPTDFLYQQVLTDQNKHCNIQDCNKFLCLIRTVTNSYVTAHRLCLLQETIKKHTVIVKSVAQNDGIRPVRGGREQSVDVIKPRVNGKAVISTLEISEEQLRQSHQDLKVLCKIKRYLALFEKHVKLVTSEEDFKIILPKLNFLKCSLSSIL